MKQIFFILIFFINVIISGVVSGHFGLLRLALSPNG